MYEAINALHDQESHVTLLSTRRLYPVREGLQYKLVVEVPRLFVEDDEKTRVMKI